MHKKLDFLIIDKFEKIERKKKEKTEEEQKKKE
jgi:hypothetical protein